MIYLLDEEYLTFFMFWQGESIVWPYMDMKLQIFANTSLYVTAVKWLSICFFHISCPTTLAIVWPLVIDPNKIVIISSCEVLRCHYKFSDTEMS